jgi:hypothetical protein
MKRKLLAAAAAAIALLGLASPSWASPVTIDFDAIPVSGAQAFTSGSEDGFTLTGADALISSLGSLVGPPFSNPNFILANGGNFLLTLVESDASAFEFLGLDGANATPGSSATINVLGYEGAKLVGTDTFTAGSAGRTFNASALSGLALTRVEITGSYENGPGIEAYVDNIRLETDATISAVPEPGTLALLGLGVAGIGAMRRRKLAG